MAWGNDNKALCESRRSCHVVDSPRLVSALYLYVRETLGSVWGPSQHVITYHVDFIKACPMSFCAHF